MSAWTDHKRKWGNCKLCPLHQCRGHRGKVVLARGSLPCDVLFTGEAPGASESPIGQAFVGPAGFLLEDIIAAAGFNVTDHDLLPVKWAMTNLVACIPLADENGEWGPNGDKVSDPPKIAIETCAPRLRELVAIAQPKMIVCVGALSDKWTKKILEGEYERAGTKTGGTSATPKAGNRGKPILSGGNTRQTPMEHSYAGLIYCSITHPAAMLRANPAQKPIMIKRAVVVLSEALEELRKATDVKL